MRIKKFKKVVENGSMLELIVSITLCIIGLLMTAIIFSDSLLLEHTLFSSFIYVAGYFVFFTGCFNFASKLADREVYYVEDNNEN